MLQSSLGQVRDEEITPRKAKLKKNIIIFRKRHEKKDKLYYLKNKRGKSLTRNEVMHEIFVCGGDDDDDDDDDNE